jgi:hypothetical protein
MIRGLRSSLAWMCVVQTLGRNLKSRLCSTSTSTLALENHDLDSLAYFIGTRKHLVLLTGAGISTASGIPDYRSPTGSYSRGHKPIVHQVCVHH